MPRAMVNDKEAAYELLADQHFAGGCIIVCG